MRTLITFAVAALAGLLAAGCSAGREAEARDPTAMVETLNGELLEAVRTGRAATAASYYDDGALLLPPGGEVVRGRTAIRRFWAEGAAFDSVATEPVAVVAGSELISHTARYTLWSTGPDGEPRAASGHFLIVWRRGEDGRWRVQADMWH